MLVGLYIENIALIDKLNVEFCSGMNVLSGETGAGKSIVIDALTFLLGAKQDKTLIKSGKTSAFVEGVFDVEGNIPLKTFLQENGFDEQCTLSRSMTADGKSQVRINGRLSTVSVLKQISAMLVDIFGQSEHTYLLKKESHIKILDSFAGNGELRKQTQELSQEISTIEKKLKSLGGSASERERALDMLSFQIKEIEEASLTPEEEETIIQKLSVAHSQEKIANALSGAVESLSFPCDVVSSLHVAASAISKVGDVDVSLEEMASRLSQSKFEVQDILETLKYTMQTMSFDQREIDALEERQDKYKKLKRKYGKTVQEVLEFLQECRDKLYETENSQKVIEQLAEQKAEIFDKLYQKAVDLSKNRNASAEKLSKEITAELKSLGMENAIFCTAELPEKAKEALWGQSLANGFDDVEFLFSANKGQPLKSLQKVISGGELSRLMLAIKNITARLENIPTMIFDEIDTGISGKMAAVVAQKIAKVSKDYQTIVITHLPQIAAMADQNFLIEKTVDGNATKTNIKKLDKQGKTSEVNRLIGGDVGEYGHLHAQDIISWSESFKKTLF